LGHADADRAAAVTTRTLHGLSCQAEFDCKHRRTGAIGHFELSQDIRAALDGTFLTVCAAHAIVKRWWRLRRSEKLAVAG
jgi:hypothetical protein